jgi:hypothetical protein
LLNAPNLFVRLSVDLVKVLAKAIQQPADFFRHACHREKLVRRVDIFTCCASAPAAEPVDEMPGLIRGDAAGQAAQVLGAVDQLDTLCMLRICRAVETLRIGQRPGAGHDHRREFTRRHARRRDRRYHLTPRPQQTLCGPL